MIKPIYLKHTLVTLSVCLLVLGSCSNIWYSTPARPFPQNIHYPNSILPNEYSRDALNQDIRSYYDRWKANYLTLSGHNQFGQAIYRIAMAPVGQEHHSITTSEGQGYGMLIVAIMAGHDTEAQNLFDGLWRFSRAHTSQRTPEFMAWRVAPDSPRSGDSNSAFDGEADIAYALILANLQWGSQEAIDYGAEALTLVTAIKRTMIGPISKLPMLGDWVNPSDHQYNQYTVRTSDFMLANFRAFYRISNDPEWLNVIDQIIYVSQYIQNSYSPLTGLLPDFIEPISDLNTDPKPVSRKLLETDHDGDYYYNAYRVPWRLGMDALLNDSLPSKALVQKMSRWLHHQYSYDIGQIHLGFKLDGTPLNDHPHFSAAMVAPFGVAAMTDPNQQAWLNQIYAALRDQHSAYYEDSINLLGLLLMTGNFWDS